MPLVKLRNVPGIVLKSFLVGIIQSLVDEVLFKGCVLSRDLQDKVHNRNNDIDPLTIIRSR